MSSVSVLTPHYVHMVLNIAHTEGGERRRRIGAADRRGAGVLSQSKEDKRRKRQSEKNEMQVPESDQTNRCQVRLKSVGWTGSSRNNAITLAHYPAKAWHNVCITSL